MKRYLLPLLVCLSCIANAQTETEIKNHYQNVNKQITESIEHGFEGSLFCNEWVTNKNSKSWRAVGNYNETIDFWYTDDPNMAVSLGVNPKNFLLKINITRKSSALKTNEEYLYKEGKLVFYYSQEGEEGNARETRIYFNAKGMFKSSVKANGKELNPKELALPENRDFKPRPSGIIQFGKKIQDLFILQMAY